MKLRLEDNTLRLRLDPPEVTAFQTTGRLETVVPLGLTAAEALVYSLERDAATPTLTVQTTAGRIRVLVPAATADAWAGSEEISLRGQLAVAENQLLHILVEKDLGCKH
ncbi:hypothetical protein CDA63_07355 [Hymenobacter amundsenii]|uniref:Uncharacterized protein n=1 Tax=Hymenobacter amundsenii TaxID=2006685 RepID=A0A246FM23_9BACT|nr:hypothetical protein [Hymenobacter amundsenii]OWP63797.1 hypothetical protein CDA63_07355 [Hymenobacter amundsenii]